MPQKRPSVQSFDIIGKNDMEHLSCAFVSKDLHPMESAVRNLQGVYVERYQEEILTTDRANLRIRVRFSQGFLLELNEAVVAEGETTRHLDYRYHFQDEESRVIFRYDNTPHFPELKNFPHHKHLEREVMGCEKPSIPQVLEEAMQHSG